MLVILPTSVGDPNQEHNCLILQQFRDCNEALSGVSSYALKTIVMNAVHYNIPEKDWSKGIMDKLFLEVI
jgi:hypothetical protein